MANIPIFQSINQFDKKFTIYQKFNSDRSICPLFALLSAYNFMNTGDNTKESHEENINLSVINYESNKINIPKYMNFDQLIDLSNNLNKKNIIATSPELISQNIIGYNSIFNFDNINNYCIIFLKNSNFIIILVKINNGKPIYCLRDCHENNQYNFDNFDNLRKFLDDIYQFEKLTIIDGVTIEEYSNIEFLVIDSKFNLNNNLITE